MDLLAIGLFAWALWLRGRPGAPRWVRFVPPAVAAMFVVSLAGTLLGLRAAFRAVEGVEPARKAELLADGIAGAMRFTAAGLLFDLGVLVALVLVAVQLRLRRAARGGL